MINTDLLRAEIDARLIIDDCEKLRIMLRDAQVLDGFILRPLSRIEVASFQASISVGMNMLKKVMPDLKSEDINTIQGRDRMKFVANLNRKIHGNHTESERKAFMLAELLTAVSQGRITIDEAVKVSNLVNTNVGESDETMITVNISDAELRNRMRHYDAAHL